MAKKDTKLPLAEDPAVIQAKQRFSIVGNSPLLLQAIARAIRVAPFDLSVLVTGESGSGKEFFPKIIHQFGARKHKKYIAVNCGAIPEGTIDSELFNKTGKEIHISFGDVIEPEEIARHKDLDDLGNFLRQKTYALKSRP